MRNPSGLMSYERAISDYLKTFTYKYFYLSAVSIEYLFSTFISDVFVSVHLINNVFYWIICGEGEKK